MLPERLAIGMQEQGWILRNKIIWEKPNPVPSYSPDRRYPVYEHVFHFVKSKKYYFDLAKAKQLNHHRDVIRNGIEPFKKHQATFPLSLIKPFILTTTKEKDVVLDPFMGSGTTAVACIELNRNYMGFEINKEYYHYSIEQANKASEKVSNQLTYKHLKTLGVDSVKMTKMDNSTFRIDFAKLDSYERFEKEDSTKLNSP